VAGGEPDAPPTADRRIPLPGNRENSVQCPENGASQGLLSFISVHRADNKSRLELDSLWRSRSKWYVVHGGPRSGPHWLHHCGAVISSAGAGMVWLAGVDHLRHQIADVSLMHGWAPLAVQALALVLLIYAVGSRPRRWWARRAPGGPGSA
jgi:hypothetical protein